MKGGGATKGGGEESYYLSYFLAEAVCVGRGTGGRQVGGVTLMRRPNTYPHRRQRGQGGKESNRTTLFDSCHARQRVARILVIFSVSLKINKASSSYSNYYVFEEDINKGVVHSPFWFLFINGFVPA